MNYLQLLKKANKGTISEKEFFWVVETLQNVIPIDDLEYNESLPYLIKIMSLAGGPCLEFQLIVENFLDYPLYPLASQEALRTLCNNWFFTSEYLPELKTFIRGVAWDESDDIRLSALSIAGEFLREDFDAELLQLLLIVFDDLGESQIIYEKCNSKRSFLKRVAYEAIARAMGQDWDDLPNDDDLENCIENKMWDLIDLAPIKEARKLINNN